MLSAFRAATIRQTYSTGIATGYAAIAPRARYCTSQYSSVYAPVAFDSKSIGRDGISQPVEQSSE